MARKVTVSDNNLIKIEIPHSEGYLLSQKPIVSFNIMNSEVFTAKLHEKLSN